MATGSGDSLHVNLTSFDLCFVVPLSVCSHLPMIPQKGIPPSRKLRRTILSKQKVSKQTGIGWCGGSYHGDLVKRHVFSLPLSKWKLVPSPKMSVR